LDVGEVLFGGYVFHYLPFFFADRTLFLHHYLPAYIFKVMLCAFVVYHVHYLVA
jgi:dolichyl-phosphate-mannose-protein mannosyltransferase